MAFKTVRETRCVSICLEGFLIPWMSVYRYTHTSKGIRMCGYTLFSIFAYVYIKQHGHTVYVCVHIRTHKTVFYAQTDMDVLTHTFINKCVMMFMGWADCVREYVCICTYVHPYKCTRYLRIYCIGIHIHAYTPPSPASPRPPPTGQCRIHK